MTTINQATVDLVKSFEGCELTAYQDSAGVWTIGYGTTGRAGLGIDPRDGMRITQDEAEMYLHRGLEKFADEIEPLITAPINENEFGAFVSLSYNIGSGAFARSTALRKFNAGDKQGAANAMLAWNKAGGQVLRGLVRRREAERALFLTPVAVDTPREDVAQDRASPAQSRTMQASAVQVASAAGAGVTAVSALEGPSQIIAIAFVGVIVLAALWIMRERLAKWKMGQR